MLRLFNIDWLLVVSLQGRLESPQSRSCLLETVWTPSRPLISMPILISNLYNWLHTCELTRFLAKCQKDESQISWVGSHPTKLRRCKSSDTFSIRIMINDIMTNFSICHLRHPPFAPQKQFEAIFKPAYFHLVGRCARSTIDHLAYQAMGQQFRWRRVTMTCSRPWGL